MSQTQPDPTRRETTRGASFRPNVDIIETTDNLILHVDMPGVRAADVDIDFHAGELRISGRVPTSRRQLPGLLHREYEVGDFYRAFEVSEQVDFNAISAQCSNGVLTLTLPKTQAAKPRKIAVHVK